MANELTMFKNGGAIGPSKVLEKSKVNANALDAGVTLGFGKVTCKGGKWGIRYQGETRMLRRFNDQGQDDGPSPFLDVVIVNAAEHSSKVWYEGKYTEGDSAPPDCSAGNGIVPDASSPKKQSETCALCQWNKWGSAVRGDGTVSKGKACADHKRLVVVPVQDIENTVYGGPMLLDVPPTSLKKLGPYRRMLAEAGFPFYGVWTRISFAEQSAFPLFEFDAQRQLTDEEATKVLKMQDDPLVERILNSEVEAGDIDRPTVPTTTAATPAAMPKPVPAPVPTPAASPPLALVPPAPAKTQEQIEYEEFQAFKAARAAKAAATNGHGPSEGASTTEEKARRPRKPRTPPVSPQPTDSAVVSAKPSEPTIPPAPTPAANITGDGNAAADAEAGAKIGALIDSLL